MMQANETAQPEGTQVHRGPEQVASWLHLVGLLLIGAGVVALGFLAQSSNSGSAPAGQLAGHGIAIRVYLVAIFMDWALFYYCWAGVHHRGGTIWSLYGGRWNSWKSVATDLGLAVPFWALWEGVAYGVARLLGPSGAKTVDSLLPQSLLEVIAWFATCITAGICEEMIFRGYLQRQVHALSGSLWIAVVGQGVIFGLFHAYQGWHAVTIISVLGVLYGGLAAWRKNLRINVVAHAWSDIWEGWLKFVIWK